MAYIPSYALSGLRNYRYRGVDKYVSFLLGCIGAIADRSISRSFLSNYVLNPFWTWFVTLWPTWVAPNLVCFAPAGLRARHPQSDPKSR
jgi:ethanolaminephosphotransferase